MASLFDNISARAESRKEKKSTYSAKDIEVLEGLEPVRKRPGMYIGGTDKDAFHHLATEIIDNSMDEAISGYANMIEIELFDNGFVSIRDNGRGIPVDPHPKFPDKSALEVIMTTLHSGGKFSDNNYTMSGGLHGVGMAVVNALSEELAVEVYRNGKIYRQLFSKGNPESPLTEIGETKLQGTKVMFKPDRDIFKDVDGFDENVLYELAKSKAFLSKGVEIFFKSANYNEKLHFPNGIKDFLTECVKDSEMVIPKTFYAKADFPENSGYAEWAVAWVKNASGFVKSYCNTIATKDGGTHEAGMKSGMLKGFKSYIDMTGTKKKNEINYEDILANAFVVLSVFLKDPQFQGQTKNRLNSPEAMKYVDTVIRNQLNHFLSSDPNNADELLKFIYERAEERLSRKKAIEISRASATKRLRLPGKLTDCTLSSKGGAEIFIVEGDSAGGSAKQARNRETQAILPLRGKILNVAEEREEKILSNAEIKNIIEALGCGIGDAYNEDNLRYDKVIVMTDADVDGAHITSLLMTFFCLRMPKLVKNGHLYLSCPPLYRITCKDKSLYALNDAEKDRILNTTFKGKSDVTISRFKGLGEMPAEQLKKTTMDPKERTLLQVTVNDGEENQTNRLVLNLMGKDAKYRLDFIYANASFAKEIDIQ